jgi:tetratricopeptide (TPR) repeat protein
MEKATTTEPLPITTKQFDSIPRTLNAFYNRGIIYDDKRNYGRAIADYNEVIRLEPDNANAFCNRGIAKLNIKDRSGNADIAKARQLTDSSSFCR